MSDTTSTTLQAVLQFALPLGATLVAGASDVRITWAVTLRAQPPAFPDVYGGELALVSMDVLRGYDSRITLEEVVRSLARVGVHAVAAIDEVSETALAAATDCNVALIALPEDSNLARAERAVTTLIVNQKAQMTQRALEVQRQLARVAAENRDIHSLLHIIARATARPVLVHDEGGTLMAQVQPSVTRRAASAGNGRAGEPAFQSWLQREAPVEEGAIVRSPVGHTILLKAEKRVAGYLSLADARDPLDDFDRLVLLHGADVCAIELAKSRAIALAVEQTRGDWVQLWLSGSPADDDLLATRAQQAGFGADTMFLAAVFRATSPTGALVPLDGLLPLVRDDMARRQLGGAAGQYVDVLVALYPLENPAQTARAGRAVEELRAQIASRLPDSQIAAGLSRPVTGLVHFREAYREAKDAISIASELGERTQTTFYGDLKLFQLLLALKERNLEHLRRFYRETLGPLAEHDERRQGDLLRTLDGFFAANGNLARAAADLDVHRNTLVYRLERIAELTGLDLDDADNRLLLQLALKVRRVLATLPG